MRYSKYHRHQHANGSSMWHIEWCTKYRYKLFKSDADKNLCQIAITEGAKKVNAEVLETEIQEEHIHMIIELPLTLNVIKAIGVMKSVSAHILFKLLPHLRFIYYRGSLWSRGKFAITVGYITLEKAKEYVRTQKAHHVEFYLDHGILAP